tara:strand:- start:22 stop:294 length:273 start_codon:yes stop_codon:yes gene_type:complete
VAKCRVQYAADITSSEPVISFKKDSVTGNYRKVTQNVTRDHKTNSVTTEKLVESEEMYKLSASDDYDYNVEYQDIDDSYKFLYFKRITED